MYEWNDEQLVSEYDSRRATAASEVVRWVEAHQESTLHRPEPLFAEREREGAVLFRPRPSRGSTYWRYGLNAEGLVVLATLSGTDGPIEQYFIAYEEGFVELARYGSPDAPEEFGRGERLPDGSLESWRACSSTWQVEEVYSWDSDGRLRQIRWVHLQRVGPTTVKLERLIVPEYEPDGRLAALIEQQAGSSNRVLIPVSVDRERRLLSDLLRRIEDRLVHVLEAHVRQSNAKSYCLALLYEPDFPLPPTPVFGPSDLSDLPTGHGDHLWHPPDWTALDRQAQNGAAFIAADPTLVDLTAMVARLDALDPSERANHIRATLNRVARRLTSRLKDLDAAPLPRFVVYATDVTGADLAVNLPAALGAELRQVLARGDFLPEFD